MADWMENQISDAEEEESGGETVTPKSAQEFTDQIRTMLATNTVEKLAVSLLKERVPEVDDTEALHAALESDTREEAQEVYRSRLKKLDALNPDTKDTEESEPDTDEESETVETEPVDDTDEESEPETESESEDTTESDEESKSPFDNASEDESEEEEPETVDESEDESTDTDTEESEEPETPETTETPDTPDTPSEPATPKPTETDGGAKSDSGTANIDVKSIAPDVITADEAAERDRRFTMLVWSDPGMGKTHFGCSSPDPVVIIDTEGKADEVAGKFRGEGRVPESPFLFQPTNYDEAMDALEKALDILDEYRTKADMTGSIVVDSMSVMWGWSQQKYVDKFYPGKDKDEVEFSSAIGGGQSDWKQIKRYHNVKFRQPMIDSPYHLVWTAMREDDYEERMKGNRDADKPAGEKENVYKVDEVLRIKEGDDGAPVGVLNKSGKIKHRYAGLRYPTFDKHRDMVDSILEAENGSRSIQAVAGEHSVRVHEGNPEFTEGDDE